MTAYINTVAEAHEEENRKENDKRRPAGNSFDRYCSDRDYQPGEI